MDGGLGWIPVRVRMLRGLPVDGLERQAKQVEA